MQHYFDIKKNHSAIDNTKTITTFENIIQNQMAKKLKSIPVYLPDEKHLALKEISEKKRQPVTRLIEGEIDKLIKRES